MSVDELPRNLTQEYFDPRAAESAIRLAIGKNDIKKAKELCDRMTLVKEASQALAPGAKVLVHSCYTGDASQTVPLFLQSLGEALLGKNGGTIIAPKKPIGSKVLAEDDPKGFWNTVWQTAVVRSTQIGQSIKSASYKQPGDAFVSTNTFSQIEIPKQDFLVPAICKCLPEKPKKWWSIDGPIVLTGGGWRDSGDICQGTLGGDSVEFQWENPKYNERGFGQLKKVSKPGEPIKYEGHKTRTHKNGVENKFTARYYVREE